MPEFFRHLTPVTRSAATGLVAAVYAQQKLAQLDQLAARNTTTHLGMPDFSHIAGRSNTDYRP